MGHPVLWRGVVPGLPTGLSRSVSPLPYPTTGGSTPTSPGDGPAAFPSVLWLWGRGTPLQLPPALLGQPTGTATRPPLNERERQQNKTHGTNGKGAAGHQPKAAERERAAPRPGVIAPTARREPLRTTALTASERCAGPCVSPSASPPSSSASPPPAAPSGRCRHWGKTAV